MPGELVLADIVLGGREWLGWAIALAAVAVVVLVWAYAQATHAFWIRPLAAILKAVGILLLAALLVEPLFSGTRPKPGNNLFLVVADNSKSLQLADHGSRESRGERMKR